LVGLWRTCSPSVARLFCTQISLTGVLVSHVPMEFSRSPFSPIFVFYLNCDSSFNALILLIQCPDFLLGLTILPQLLCYLPLFCAPDPFILCGVCSFPPWTVLLPVSPPYSFTEVARYTGLPVPVFFFFRIPRAFPHVDYPNFPLFPSFASFAQRPLCTSCDLRRFSHFCFVSPAVVFHCPFYGFPPFISSRSPFVLPDSPSLLPRLFCPSFCVSPFFLLSSSSWFYLLSPYFAAFHILFLFIPFCSSLPLFLLLMLHPSPCIETFVAVFSAGVVCL